MPIKFEAILGFAVVAAAAFNHGAYYPTTWGLFATCAVWVIVVRIALGKVSLGALEVAVLTALAALASWLAASSIWGVPERGILEAERIAMYVTVTAAACFALRRRTLPALLTGVWLAVSVVAAYSLATRLLPERLGVSDPIGAYRLSEPIGYWNGLGVFVAMGVMLAAGLTARASAPGIRMLAAATLPVLCSTLYFTYSRGAWIALGIGLVTAISLDSRRLQLITTLLILSPVTVITLVVAYRFPALNRIGAAPADASQQGHRLGLLLIAAVLLSALVAYAAQRLERRGSPGQTLLRAYAMTLIAAVLAGVITGFVLVGSPPTLVARAYDAFAAPPPNVGSRVNERLFNLSGTGRVLQWRVAWEAYEREPLLGSGAGTYEQSWNEFRPTPGKVRDAHSLYLETLAEVGPLGLGLLLAALGIPILAAVRARRYPLVSTTLGAYAAFVAHAGVDWDWELPAVTLLGLLCAAALLIAARGDRAWLVSGHMRAVVAAASLAVAGLSVVGLVGNRALADGEEALEAGQAQLAAERASVALRWAPWSAQAHRLLAETQLARGHLEGARERLRQAVAADPRDWTLWFALAQTTVDPESARALAEARRLNPLSPEIQTYISSPDVSP